MSPRVARLRGPRVVSHSRRPRRRGREHLRASNPGFCPFRVAAWVHLTPGRVTRGVFRDPRRVRVRVRVNLSLERERGENVVLRLDVLGGHRRRERRRIPRLLRRRQRPAKLGRVQTRARGAEPRGHRGSTQGTVHRAGEVVREVGGEIVVAASGVVSRRRGDTRGWRGCEARLKRRHRRSPERAETGWRVYRRLRGKERAVTAVLRVQAEALQAVPRGDHHGDVLLIRGGRRPRR
mmetsp:Transcript_7411/g.33473  ORF Transcript_7411/g.33473 Transcript_7411/m.33473 type:complete len:236 (-) Transcript_7411:542-1249(-)